MSFPNEELTIHLETHNANNSLCEYCAMDRPKPLTTAGYYNQLRKVWLDLADQKGNMSEYYDAIKAYHLTLF